MTEELKRIRIEDCNLHTRSLNCFCALEIKYLDQVADMTEEELLSLRNFGSFSLGEVKTALKKHGLCLRTPPRKTYSEIVENVLDIQRKINTINNRLEIILECIKDGMGEMRKKDAS